MWRYSIKTGWMVRNDDTFQGYSGAGHALVDGRNNPAMQNIPNVGPIPVGMYTIGAPHDSPRTGRYTMDLNPIEWTGVLTAWLDMYGRSAFRIHGNNAEDDASHGCIILPPGARRAVWESGDHALQVVTT